MRIPVIRGVIDRRILVRRVFPGIHSHAKFTVKETETHFEVMLRSDDGVTSLSVVGDAAADLPTTSIFDSLADASAFSP